MQVRITHITIPTRDLFNYVEERGGQNDPLTAPLDRIPEFAGRVCYDSFANPRPGGNGSYLEHIKEVGHTSILEHSSIGFLFEDVSRSVTHELVRHRVGAAYSQESQRYVNQSDVEFCVPPAIRENETALRVFNDAVEECRWAYTQLLECLSHLPHKQAREAARSVLPNATPTTIEVTWNLRSIRHFLELRGSPAADAEIREVAIEICRLVKQVSPNVFADFKIVGDEVRRASA